MPHSLVRRWYNARMDKPTLRKALHLLAHPLTLGAIGLLLVNDHVLRRAWPSALTGKLGDLAWLFFIPLVVAAAVALVLPGRRHSRAAGLIAYSAVGVVFALAKTVPWAHTAVVAAAEALFGFEVGWRRDPTDLIALAGLLASAGLWARTPEPRAGRPRLAAPGWAVLVMAVLLTVANAPAPDPGIYCLDALEGEVHAHAAYSSWRSTDGGLTWQEAPSRAQEVCPAPWSSPTAEPVIVTDPRDAARQYRFAPGQAIELTEDNGTTWRIVRPAQVTSEAVLAATRRQVSSWAEVRPTPMHAAIDRGTGNAIFAMGHAGVLVHGADGAWREIAVGGYRPFAVAGVFDLLRLLVGEMLLALGFALGGFATLATRTFDKRKAIWIAALVVAWAIFALVAFAFPPALARGYGESLSYLGLAALGVVLVIMVAIAIGNLLRQDRPAIGRTLLVCLLAGLLFLLPYGLWATDALPRYLLASIFGTLLGAAVLLAGSRWIARLS